MAARAALLPRVTKGLIDLGLKQKSSSTTLRDKPEVDWLRACMVFAGGIAIYTASQELVSPRAGSFFNVDLRGDIDRQMAAAEAAAMKEGRMAPEGQSSATAPKHTWWWRLAHWRKEAQPATPSGLGDSSNRVKLPSPSSMV